MPPETDHRDFGYLWDMREHAREAISFVEGMTEDEYQHDLKTQRATERSIEIVGEAAKKVSSSTRKSTPQIDWKDICGLREKLAHDYSGIQAEIIWRITQDDLRLLVIQLDHLIGTEL